MTILVRLLVILALFVAAGYAAAWSLATLVVPEQRDVTVTIPASRFAK